MAGQCAPWRRCARSHQYLSEWAQIHVRSPDCLPSCLLMFPLHVCYGPLSFRGYGCKKKKEKRKQKEITRSVHFNFNSLDLLFRGAVSGLGVGLYPLTSRWADHWSVWHIKRDPLTQPATSPPWTTLPYTRFPVALGCPGWRYSQPPLHAPLDNPQHITHCF